MRSVGNKVWNYKQIDEKKAKDIRDKLGISRFLARILSTLNIDNIDDVSKFLKPKIEYLNDPFLLNDMDVCVDRIIKAVDNKEKIVIFGDYDVDGITSTALLYDFLTKIGGDVDYYIPNRIDEGYGLSKKSVDNALDLNPKLIVTVDCGITALEEVDYIKSNNVDIIITDHHECMESLPNAYGVINPTRVDSTYPFRYLAGVGVALKVIMALCKKRNLQDYYLNYMDVVALGTVADVVNLTGENRVIVRYGLKKMMKMPNLGLEKLIFESGLKGKKITTTSVGFVLAPRLNAAGRLFDAKKCVILLTTQNENEASKIAYMLQQENKLRQQKEQEILEQAIQKIESKCQKDDKVIVVSGENWHKGVIGIVASRIVDKYFKPCIVFTIKDGIADGSARSIKDFDMYSAISSCKDILLKFGGHEMAAGLALNVDQIDNLRQRLNKYADEKLKDEEIKQTIDITMQLESNELTMDNAKRLEHLKPFGTGNPSPIFACHNIKVSNVQTIGQDKHLKLNLGEQYVDALVFNRGELIEKININDYIDVAFELNRNIWNDRENLQMIVKDLKLKN